MSHLPQSLGPLNLSQIRPIRIALQILWLLEPMLLSPNTDLFKLAALSKDLKLFLKFPSLTFWISIKKSRNTSPKWPDKTNGVLLIKL